MSQDSVEVRPAKPQDGDRLFELLAEFATSYRPMRAAFDRSLTGMIPDANAQLLVARRDETVIGYVLAARIPTLYANGPILEIQELIVDPVERGQGLGRALIEAVVHRAWRDGCVEVTVPTRRAGDYYAKLGFEKTAEYYKLRRPI